MTLTTAQQDALKAKFIDAVRSYLNPVLPDDKEVNKQLANQMRDVLLLIGFNQSQISLLIEQAKQEEYK